MTNANPANAPARLALRSREAAKALGISERLLWTLTQDGTVPHTRISKGVVLYSVQGLQKWLDGKSCAKGTDSDGEKDNGPK